MSWIDPHTTLEGNVVRLEPLTPAHHAGLCDVGLDDELWRWTLSLVRSPEEMQRYIEQALQERAAGTAFPFATIDRASGRVVGSTRYGNMDATHRKLEIGWTWIGGPWQRTAVNTEAKYLMLRHAFEVMDCLRVEFKTDVLNARSRAALTRIGAIEEGILRSHMITASGRTRDTVYFSILAAEWPRVKTTLAARLPASNEVPQ